MTKIKIGVIGGSGLYQIDGLKSVKNLKVTTPFGKPSSALTTGMLDGVPMVFLPRHGKGHMLSPSEINYRANIFAMKKLGVTHIVSISAVGSMKEHIAPGDFLIVDQFIDRTKGIRASTFFKDGLVGHVSMADPVCSCLRNVLLNASKNIEKNIHEKGTYVCMEGPQFSTRAESFLYRSWGVDVIGMTNIPECMLAREAEICYATVALVTDYDCWKEGEEAVSVETVMETMKHNIEAAKQLIKNLPGILNTQKCGKACHCHEAAKYAIMTHKNAISKKAKMKLKPLFGKYF